jgi:hypothetical protein
MLVASGIAGGADVLCILRTMTDAVELDVPLAEVEAARERIAALGAPPEDPVGGDGVGGWRQVARR